MLAFHGEIKIKKFYLDRVVAHQRADEIVKGRYWQEGKGCAVGCTIHGNDHAAYETELGVPEWLALVEDVLFENLPNELAKEWPAKFIAAINVGSDLETIKRPFLIYLLQENLKTLESLHVDPQFKNVIEAIELTKAATHKMITAHQLGDESAAWSAESAESVARSMARSAESVARSMARSAVFVKHAEKLLELISNCK